MNPNKAQAGQLASQDNNQTPPTDTSPAKTEINRYQRYFANFTIRLGILRSAAITFSALSFVTTFQGFSETVFMGEGLMMTTMAALASAAVQSVLLAGIFFYCPIVNMLLNVLPDKASVMQYLEYNGKIEKASSVEPLFEAIVAVVILGAASFFTVVFFWKQFYWTTFAVVALLMLAGAVLLFCVTLGIFSLFKFKKEPGETVLGVLRKKSYNYLKVWLITCVILTAMAISTMFSCVSITNSLYTLDYARDCDSAIEETLRKEILTADAKIDALLKDTSKFDGKTMRFYLIDQLNGLNTEIESNARDKARDFFIATPEIAEILKADLLYDDGSGNQGGKNYKVPNDYAKGNPLFFDASRTDDKWYIDTDDRIQKINSEIYQTYAAYHSACDEIRKQYNDFKKSANNTKATQKITLVKLRAMKSSLTLLRDAIATQEQVNEWNTERSKGAQREQVLAKDNENTILLQLESYQLPSEEVGRVGKVTKQRAKVIDPAILTFLELRTEIQNVIDKIDDLIKAAYGEDALTIHEIVEIVGLSDPSNETPADGGKSDIQILEQALKQFRDAQGEIIKAKPKDNDGKEVDVQKIANAFNNYVELMKTKARLSDFSKELNTSYIIKDNDNDSDTQESGRTANGSDDNAQQIDNVDVDTWRDIRNKQLVKLKDIVTSLQFVENSMGEDKDQEEAAIAEIDSLIHMYINATELETTSNLLFNHGVNRILSPESPAGAGSAKAESKQYYYFTYRGKAFLALGFAIFMDFGSALIGVLMYFLDPKEMEKKLIGYSNWMKAFKNHPAPGAGGNTAGQNPGAAPGAGDGTGDD